MLDNALGVVNYKGGVGKTSIAANVAASAALGGWNVLAADLDPQGNLGRDLGYWQRSGDGRALLDAVRDGREVEPIRGVRDRLDVVAGGSALESLGDVLTDHGRDPDGAGARLERALGFAAHRYNLVVIDFPPTASRIVAAGLAVTHFMLVPTTADAASIDGLVGLAETVGAIRETANPDLEVLGVVLFNVNPRHTALIAEARGTLEPMLVGVAPLLGPFVRSSQRGSFDMRERGEVAYEYEQAALAAKPWFADRETRQLSRTASGLAGDYQALTEEVLDAFVRRQTGPTADPDTADPGTADPGTADPAAGGGAAHAAVGGLGEAS